MDDRERRKTEINLFCKSEITSTVLLFLYYITSAVCLCLRIYFLPIGLRIRIGRMDAAPILTIHMSRWTKCSRFILFILFLPNGVHPLSNRRTYCRFVWPNIQLRVGIGGWHTSHRLASSGDIEPDRFLYLSVYSCNRILYMFCTADSQRTTKPQNDNNNMNTLLNAYYEGKLLVLLLRSLSLPPLKQSIMQCANCNLLAYFTLHKVWRHSCESMHKVHARS